VFTELLGRTCFSFLRASSHPEELVQRAHELGQQTLGLCDLDGIYGVVRGWTRAKELGLRVLVGAELSLDMAPSKAIEPSEARAPVEPVTVALLVQSPRGYENLCHLLTKGHADRPKGEYACIPEWLGEHAEGLVALVPAPVSPGTLSRAHHEVLTRLFAVLREKFAGRAYVATYRHLDGLDGARTSFAVSVSERHGLPVLATSRPRYHAGSRGPLADVMHCIRLGVTLEEAGTGLAPNHEAFLRSEAQMQTLFADHPEWVSRTTEVAQTLRFELSDLKYHFPCELEPGQSADERLAELTWEGVGRRYPRGISEELRQQIKKELRLIQKIGVAPYFLSTRDIVEIARRRRILCQGRGSAANSAVCYVLGITAVDPARSKLLFERFLSEERAEPPDIDIDFEHERREEVIQEIYERYGRERAAMVSEIISYRGKSSLREVGKVFGLSLEQVDRLSGTLTHWDASEAAESRLEEAGFDVRDVRLRQVVALAGQLQGFPRHLSIHVGGFVLSSRPLQEVAPIEPARMEGRTVIPWDKDDIDALGFFKVDVLGLGMLTAIRKALALIHADGGLRGIGSSTQGTASLAGPGSTPLAAARPLPRSVTARRSTRGEHEGPKDRRGNEGGRGIEQEGAKDRRGNEEDEGVWQGAGEPGSAQEQGDSPEAGKSGRGNAGTMLCSGDEGVLGGEPQHAVPTVLDPSEQSAEALPPQIPEPSQGEQRAFDPSVLPVPPSRFVLNTSELGAETLPPKIPEPSQDAQGAFPASRLPVNPPVPHDVEGAFASSRLPVQSPPPSEEFDPLEVITRIPAEDPAVYDMICRADTVGVFQIESRAQMAMLPRLRPRKFSDLVIEVAIVRPGPIQGGMVHPYLRRRNGEEDVSYPHRDLIGILDRTMGVPLFQEQVMQISITGAGYTGGEADQLRRDMAAWKKTGRLMRHRDRLLEGFSKKGISREFGEALFEQIKGFGDYGFPESHASSFALLVYASSWEKAHYPAHFACALLNSQPMGFYQPTTLVRDAQRHGVEVRDVCVLQSTWDSTLEEATDECRIRSTEIGAKRALRLGLRLVKGLGEASARRIEAERAALAPATFRSLEELTRLCKLEKDEIEALAEAGALEALVPGRRQALWKARAPRTPGLFEARDVVEPEVALPALHATEQLILDYGRKGLSVGDHPMNHLRKRLSKQGVVRAADLQYLKKGTPVAVAGLVLSRQQPGTASGVVFITLEDETGFANLIVYSSVYEQFHHVARHSSLLIARGEIEREAKPGLIVPPAPTSSGDAARDAAGAPPAVGFPATSGDQAPVIHVIVRHLERIERRASLSRLSRNFH
jgi:DNA polymerase III alpha subunit